MTPRAALLVLFALAACNGGGAADAGRDAAPIDATTGDGPHIDGPTCTDADGDGHGATSCGGDDCDDGDANRYPSNVEVCDALGHDEDCDPATLGTDADHDGFPYAGCCNGQPSGAVLCGTDCDDMRATVSPTAAEVCDGVDDDCDGLVDEGVATTFCFDRDGDGYGELATASSGCRLPPGATGNCGDCDDHDPNRHPGYAEPCDGVDHDCDGVPDDGCACTTGSTQPCGTSVGACVAGVQHCVAGVWASACDGATLPAVETCDGVDDDCDGMVDEGLTTTFEADCDSDGYGDDATAMQRCSAPASAPPACARGVWTTTGGDCNDRDGARFPGHGCTSSDGGVPDAGIDGGTPHDVVALALGDQTSCALRATGTVLCWGANRSGQLARGSYTGGEPIPDVALGVAGATAIAVGPTDACALVAGVPTCWGDDYGAAGSTITSTMAMPLGAIAGIAEIALAGEHGCLRDTTGAVSCFGADYDGELGDGTFAGPPFLVVFSPPPVPVAVSGLVDAAELAVGNGITLTDADGGVTTTGAFSCARRTSGAVVCWGSNTVGQLGDGAVHGTCTNGDCATTPVAVSGLTDAVELAAGDAHVCARRTSGAVVCWGEGTAGQLGDGATTSRATPVTVTGLTDAVELAAGGRHTCARRTSGAVVCWGANASGELGDTTTTDRGAPTAVPGLTDAVELAAGRSHTCARRATSAVVCWGDNDSGALGDGTLASTTTPTLVALP